MKYGKSHKAIAKLERAIFCNSGHEQSSALVLQDGVVIQTALGVPIYFHFCMKFPSFGEGRVSYIPSCCKFPVLYR